MRIAITGGFGFIGSSLVKFLNNLGINSIDIFEQSSFPSKWKNAIDLNYDSVYSEDTLFDACYRYDAIIHLGANSSTSQEASTENWKNNITYSTHIINSSYRRVDKPVFIFASSAATYGSETKDFSERVNLKPTNFYGFTKLEVDKFIAKTYSDRDKVFSLRFFNVYGSREHHKAGMSSPIYSWLESQRGGHPAKIKLFESSNLDYSWLSMARDFVHVEDVCKVIWHCMNQSRGGGIYNVGSGKATTWLEAAQECISQTGNSGRSEIVRANMPDHMQKYYQYHTCADLTNLRNKLNYTENFLSIQEGIAKTLEELNSQV